jgi:hypothetical protein
MAISWRNYTRALYSAAEKLFRSRSAGFFSALISLLWWDNIHWNTVAMTESIFCSLICLVFYQLVNFNGKKTDWVALILLLILVFFTRPTSIVVIVGVTIFVLRYYWTGLSQKPLTRYAIMAMLVMVGFAGAFLMFSLWDFTDELKKGNIITYADTIEGGSFYHEILRVRSEDLSCMNSETHPLTGIISFIACNPIYFLKTAAIKVGLLLSATRPYYSWEHNVFSVVWTSVVYIAFFAGWKHCTNKSVKLTVLAIVVVNCLLIGISTLDWDNRFYIPMAPGIALIAGGGAAHLLRPKLNR